MSATAAPAPPIAATRVRPSVSVGSASASSTAGKVASRPNAAVFRIAEPASTPSGTLMFQTVNSAAPQVQNAALRRAGSVCRNANATDSSVTSCAPISRVPHRLALPPPALVTSETARP